MRDQQLRLSDEETLATARTTQGEHLYLEAEGYKCSTEDLLNVLIGVAADQGTIESVCADLVGTPDPQTIRNYIRPVAKQGVARVRYLARNYASQRLKSPCPPSGQCDCGTWQREWTNA